MSEDKAPEDEHDAEIISLADFQAGAEPVFRVVRAPTCWCSLTIDEKSMTITCKRCGKVYEPFAALLLIVRDWPRFAANRDALKAECKQLVEKRDALRTELKNLKAQWKRAKEKDSP